MSYAHLTDSSNQSLLPIYCKSVTASGPLPTDGKITCTGMDVQNPSGNSIVNLTSGAGFTPALNFNTVQGVPAATLNCGPDICALDCRLLDPALNILLATSAASRTTVKSSELRVTPGAAATNPAVTLNNAAESSELSRIAYDEATNTLRITTNTVGGDPDAKINLECGSASSGSVNVLNGGLVLPATQWLKSAAFPTVESKVSPYTFTPTSRYFLVELDAVADTAAGADIQATFTQAGIFGAGKVGQAWIYEQTVDAGACFVVQNFTESGNPNEHLLIIQNCGTATSGANKLVRLAVQMFT